MDTVSVSIQNASALAGTVDVVADVQMPDPVTVSFYLDDALVSTQGPVSGTRFFSWAWDTSTSTLGPHAVRVEATSAATAAQGVTVVGPVPANTAPPTVSGTSQTGQTLTATPGDWTGAPSYAYQWLRCDSTGANPAAITGATAATYLVQGADAGLALMVAVTATNYGGSVTVNSAPTAPAAPAPATGPKGLATIVYGKTLADSSMYDYLVCSYGKEGAARAKTTLSYVSAVSVNRNWWSGVSAAVADANDSWYLRDASGAYMLNRGYPTNRIADPGNTGYQGEWAREVIAHMQAVGSNGVFVDDGVLHPPNLMGVFPPAYPTDAAWQAVMVSFLAAVYPKLKAAGLTVVVNANGFVPGNTASNTGLTDQAFWKALAPYVDGLNREYWEQAGSVGGAMFTDNPAVGWTGTWLSWLSLIDTAQNAGKAFFGIVALAASPPANVERFARASFLLRWNGGPGALILSKGGYNGAYVAYDPRWTQYLGVPTGPAVKVGSCYTRPFQTGTLLVNPTSSAQTVNGVTVGAQDALIG